MSSQTTNYNINVSFSWAQRNISTIWSSITCSSDGNKLTAT